MSAIENAFRTACAKVGLQHRPIPADGHWHPLQTVEGKRNNSGRAKLFCDGLGGLCCNWRTGEQQAFFASDPRKLNRAEQIERRRWLVEAQQKAALELEQLHTAAACRAKELLQKSRACKAHPYLTRKGLEPSPELRTLGASLVVPMRDIFGELWSLQLIQGNGEKRFLRNGRKKSTFALIGGKPSMPVQPAETSAQIARICPTTQNVVLCEGIATAISLHRLSGFQTFCAFDAGNLASVASAIRDAYPNCTLFIGADHDTVGIDKAKAAAFRFGAKVCIPPNIGDDWNDTHQRLGEPTARQRWQEACE